MKKILSIILALMMLASAASLAVSAGNTNKAGPILYEDDFEDGKDETFWQNGDKMSFDDGVMSGFSDAVVVQSRYKWLKEGSDTSTTSDWPCQQAFTEWVEVRLADTDGEDARAGFWIQDGANAERGYEDDRTIYSVMYVAADTNEETGDTRTAFATLYSDTQRKEKTNPEGAYPGADYPNHIYGTLDLDGEFIEGFNLDENNDPIGEAVKIGVRFGHGNITGYANGKIVGSYDFSTIGELWTPILFHHYGGYVEFDNYGLAVYDYNVKAMTRRDSYNLYEGKVTIKDGGKVVKEISAAEDDELTIVAPKIEGRQFLKNWDAIFINGVEIKEENFEKIALLYGIELGSLKDEKFTMIMPDCDVELLANYVNGVDDRPDEVDPSSIEYPVTVKNGTASVAQAPAGAEITVTAKAAPEGMKFDHWEFITGGEFINEEDKDGKKETLTFRQTEGGCSIVAIYVDESGNVVDPGLDDVKAGDVNGDDALNAKDVTSIMKFLVGKTPKDFNEAAADYNGDGKTNAKDVTGLMKFLVKGA